MKNEYVRAMILCVTENYDPNENGLHKEKLTIIPNLAAIVDEYYLI